MKKTTHVFKKRSQLLSTAIGLALAWPMANVALAQDESIEEVVVTGSRIVRRDFESLSPIVTVQAETFENRANIGIESALNQLPQFTPAGTQASLSSAGTPFPQATAAPGAATVNLRGLGTNRNLVLVDGRRVQPVNGALVVDLNTIPSAAIESVEIISGGAAAVYGADAISGVINLKLKRNFQGADFDLQYGLTQEGDGEELQLSTLVGADFSDGRGNVMIGANYADRGDIYSRDRGWVRDGWNDPGTMGGGIGSSNLTSFNPGQNGPQTIGFASGPTYAIDQNGNVFDPLDPLNAANPYTGPIGEGSNFKINPDGSLGFDDQDHAYLQVPLERYSLFGSSSFDLTDSLTWYTDLRYSETVAEARGFVSGLFNIWSPTVPYNPQYDDPNSPDFGMAPPGVAQHPVPAGLAALLNDRADPTAPWTYEGGLDYLPNFQTKTTSNVFQIVQGLGGDIAGTRDWTWDVYYSHGKSTVNAQQPEGFPYLPRIQNLFNADQYGTGYSVNYPIAVTGNCTTGLPIFNEDGSVNNTPSVSQDCADYVVLRMNSVTTLTQNVAEANFQGTLIDLPAGPLQFAAGVGYREEDFKFDPDSGYNANQDFPNVVQNIILPVGVDDGTNVKEFYMEFAIPLLEGLPFMQSLSFDPGYRYSDYNTLGGVDTWKLMGDWTVNDNVRFRGGIQRANRAPNVAELFTPVGGSQLGGGVDACANFIPQTPSWGNVAENPNRLNVQILCQELITRDGAPPSLYEPGTPSANDYRFNVFGATNFFPFVIGVTEGNPNLRSESADTFTLGVVLDSPFEAPLLQNMRLSLDYYNIEIEDAIGTPDHDTVYQQCLDARYNDLVGSAPGSVTGAELAANNPFCALIQREYIGDGINDFGADRRFSAQFINQGGLKSVGYDVQLDWGAELADMGFASAPGALSVNLLVSVLDEYSISPFPGAEFIDFTGTTNNSSFDYKVFTTINYVNGPLSLGLRWQYLPSVDTEPGASPDLLGVDSYQNVDLFGRWSMGERYVFRAGIDNLFNEDPNVVGASSTDNNLGSTNINYDIFGRRMYLGMKVSF